MTIVVKLKAKGDGEEKKIVKKYELASFLPAPPSSSSSSSTTLAQAALVSECAEAEQEKNLRAMIMLKAGTHQH